MRQTTWTCEKGPYDLRRSLIVLRRGPYDPAFRQEPDGTTWRASRTPLGPATIRLTPAVALPRPGAAPGTGAHEADAPRAAAAAPAAAAPGAAASGAAASGAASRLGRAADGDAAHHPATTRSGPTGVRATAWGPGGPWLLDRLPALLGADDDPEAFAAYRGHHRLLDETHRRHQGVRLIRTGLVLESLIPSILEQKITTDEAYRAWRRLLRRFGEPAPGPQGHGAMPEGMAVMPDRRGWLQIPSWEWHRAGVDSKRSATVLRAVRVAPRLEEAAAMALPAASARLQHVTGIGPWTAAEVLQRSNGAADAVTVGDLHLPGIVGHALAGERDADDARMLELLEPYRGQRHRAARLIMLSGRVPKRRAPRRAHWDIARL